MFPLNAQTSTLPAGSLNVRKPSGPGSLGQNVLRACFLLGMVVAGAGLAHSADWTGTEPPTETLDGRSWRTALLNEQVPEWSDLLMVDDRLSEIRVPARFRTRDPGEMVAIGDSMSADVSAELSAVATLQTAFSDVQSRITARYQNSAIIRFLETLTAERGLQLFMESARLIDARHIDPASHQVRIEQAAVNLSEAVENPVFLRVNGISPSEYQVTTFRGSMDRLVAERPVRSVQESLNMLYWTIDLAGRHLGLRPQTVALEFVFAATEALDAYSTFVPDATALKPSAALEDHVVGIGVEIKAHDEGVLVVKPLRGGPAEAAGLKPNDIIVSVNGQSLAGRSLDAVVGLISGPAGSQVRLGIRRENVPVSTVTMVRRRVEIMSVSEVRMIDPVAKVGYLKLDSFSQKTSEEVDQALWDLYRQGMQSLVFDLRGNPGGLLTTAIELSNKFLPCGTIVSTRGRQSADNLLERATFAQTWKVPLVVLIDENSASASELFAAAIQDNRRGVIVGSPSYGKGTVQSHFPLQSVAGNLRLTTARFYSPSGRALAGTGVDPDVVVETASLNGIGGEDAALSLALSTAKGDQPRELAASAVRCPPQAVSANHLSLQSLQQQLPG